MVSSPISLPRMCFARNRSPLKSVANFRGLRNVVKLENVSALNLRPCGAGKYLYRDGISINICACIWLVEGTLFLTGIYLR